MCAYVWAEAEERIVMGGCDGRCSCSFSFEDVGVVAAATADCDEEVIFAVDIEALTFER